MYGFEVLTLSQLLEELLFYSYFFHLSGSIFLASRAEERYQHLRCFIDAFRLPFVADFVLNSLFTSSAPLLAFVYIFVQHSANEQNENLDQ